MNKILEEKLVAYYTHYYKEECCLPDYTQRVQNRLKEEDQDHERLLKLEKWLDWDFHHKKHFIVGAGTAGLAVVLYQRYQAEVFGIEPSAPEMEIIKLKAAEYGFPPENFKQEFGEQLSAPSNTFDFIYCITVLEHVQNVEKCLQEMIRIVKPGGKVYINTPNYAYPYEGHYKINLPTWSKWLSRWWLKALGKSDQFLKTINLFSASDLDRLLQKQKGIVWQRIYEPLSLSSGSWGRLLNFLKFKMNIYPTQNIVITKL